MKAHFFVLIVGMGAFNVNGWSQNLLPNGSFEMTQDFDYDLPFIAYKYVRYWYPASYIQPDSGITGTPDLYDDNRRVARTDPPNFWNKAVGAADGDFYIGLVNSMMYEGFHRPEAAGSGLLEPLEPFEYYHVGLMVRNKGVIGVRGEPMLCVPEENKRIEIFLNRDSVYVFHDGMNKNSYSNASIMIPLRSGKLETPVLEDWQEMGTCFQAEGEEQFLAVSMSTGKFTVNPPCIIYEEHWRAFYEYYFDIDDIRLTKLPDAFFLEDTICVGRETKINITDLVDLPIMQSEIKYHWDDGRVDSVNYISEGGTYFVEAIIDCKTIPITLNITDIKCDPDIYVPNIFSPNNDGINDYFEAFIAVDLPITKYYFSVFNRWGINVFSTNDADEKWDGTFDGNTADSGVYVWVLEFTINDVELGIVDYKRSGDITILK